MVCSPISAQVLERRAQAPMMTLPLKDPNTGMPLQGADTGNKNDRVYMSIEQTVLSENGVYAPKLKQMAIFIYGVRW